MTHEYELITAFESSMLVEKGRKHERYFNEGLLNHIIQFNGEDPMPEDETETEELVYRVLIQRKVRK